MECLTEFTTKLELIQQFSARNHSFLASQAAKINIVMARRLRRLFPTLPTISAWIFGYLCVLTYSILSTSDKWVSSCTSDLGTKSLRRPGRCSTLYRSQSPERSVASWPHFLYLQQLPMRTPSRGAVLVELTSRPEPLPAILTLIADLSSQAVPLPLLDHNTHSLFLSIFLMKRVVILRKE